MAKFKVGDRVRCVDDADAETFLNRGGEYTVIRPGGDHVIVSGCNAWMRANRFELIPAAPPEPQDLSHAWQVGRTYKTTLEGVTATIKSVGDYVRATRSDMPLSWAFQKTSGKMVDHEDDAKVPHLLPIEVATPSEQIRQDAAESLEKWDAKRADIGPQSASPSSPGRVEAQARDAAKQIAEGDPVNHPPHYTQHPSGVECITVTEHMNFCCGNAVKYIWRAGEKGDAVEDLRKAVWYLQREIERLERMKGSAT